MPGMTIFQRYGNGAQLGATAHGCPALRLLREECTDILSLKEQQNLQARLEPRFIASQMVCFIL